MVRDEQQPAVVKIWSDFYLHQLKRPKQCNIHRSFVARKEVECGSRDHSEKVNVVLLLHSSPR